jgi:hypothetical protein
MPRRKYERKRYHVQVGNIGTVIDTDDPAEARRRYGSYKHLSELGQGRAGNEPVYLFDVEDLVEAHETSQEG